MPCPNCGESLSGDGYTRVVHCPNTESDTCVEPDANPIYCNFKDIEMTPTDKLFEDARASMSKNYRQPIAQDVVKSLEGQVVTDRLVGDKPIIKLVIAGGRDFTDYSLLEHTLRREYLHRGDIEVVCGKARGADSLGEHWATEHGAVCHAHPADWDKHGKSAGYKRNKEMGEFADEVLVFWDGISKGTKHMIDLAKELGKPLHIVNY